MGKQVQITMNLKHSAITSGSMKDLKNHSHLQLCPNIGTCSLSLDVPDGRLHS